MSDSAMTAPSNALAAKQAQEKSYRKKGIFIALMSGFLYGGYTAFLTQGMASGIWVDYYGGTGVAAGLSAFALVYTLSAVGAAVNDICSAVWTLIYAAIIGRLGDFARSINTKPGRIVILAAIIGRIIYKQKLTGGMILGIVICFTAAVIIGLFGYGIPEGGLAGIFGNMSGQSVIGIIAAFCAALGWGIEGAVGGYACCMVDTEVAICIRQCTSGIVNAVILCSLLSLIGGDGIGSGLALVGHALADGPSIWMFFIGGVFASWSFKFWYKGASMCGAALGMGCNGTYAFWGPLYCLVVCGLIFGGDGWNIAWPGWVGAITMVIGIFVLAISQQKATEKEA